MDTPTIFRSLPGAERNQFIEYGDPPEQIKRAMHELLIRKGLIQWGWAPSDRDAVLRMVGRLSW